MIISGSDSDSIKEYFLENNEWIKSQYNTNFDKKCRKDEFKRGAILNDFICSRTYHGDYRWRAIGNPGDIHNHQRGRQRGSPSIEDEIYFASLVSDV